MAYHSSCLRMWESHHGFSCPTCRTPMRPDVRFVRFAPVQVRQRPRRRAWLAATLAVVLVLWILAVRTRT